MQVLARRVIVTESALSSVLNKLTTECRRSFTSQVLSTLENRNEMERQALERDPYSTNEATISLPGRQSGDKEWRILRCEYGSGENGSLSSSSCPVRVCIDEYVTRVYNAFRPLLSYFVKTALSISTALEVLRILQSILVDLQKSPFKTRKALLDSASNTGQSFVHQFLPYFDELLDALSLSRKETEGRIEFCLAGNPIQLSLALPVALDALEDSVSNLKKCENLNEDLLSLPLLKLNRIHSGSVVASGEEIPFGIVSCVGILDLFAFFIFVLKFLVNMFLHEFQVTSAFDGFRTTKWEEPNGAGGNSDPMKDLSPHFHNAQFISKTPQNKNKKLEVILVIMANN